VFRFCRFCYPKAAGIPLNVGNETVRAPADLADHLRGSGLGREFIRGDELLFVRVDGLELSQMGEVIGR
jgi:hypothetical protein